MTEIILNLKKSINTLRAALVSFLSVVPSVLHGHQEIRLKYPFMTYYLDTRTP